MTRLQPATCPSCFLMLTARRGTHIIARKKPSEQSAAWLLTRDRRSCSFPIRWKSQRGNTGSTSWLQRWNLTNWKVFPLRSTSIRIISSTRKLRCVHPAYQGMSLLKAWTGHRRASLNQVMKLYSLETSDHSYYRVRSLTPVADQPQSYIARIARL